MSIALAALTFGLTAGLKPGPLGVFVIHQTLSKGPRHGFLSSLAPLVTDGPIILLAYLLASFSADFDLLIAVVSIIGGLYLAKIALKLYRSPNLVDPKGSSKPSSGLLTAIKINALNPAPYIFWLTIGLSYINMGTYFEAMLFILVALVSLCLSKFVVALFIKSLGDRFSHKAYAQLLKSLCIPLIIFSVHLLYSGLSILTK